MAKQFRVDDQATGLDGKIIYKPCKSCKALDYDNADCKNPEFTKDDKILFEPTKCDQCDFALVIPESTWEH